MISRPGELNNSLQRVDEAITEHCLEVCTGHSQAAVAKGKMPFADVNFSTAADVFIAVSGKGDYGRAST